MKNSGSALSAVKKNYARVINLIRSLAMLKRRLQASVHLVRATSLKLQASSIKHQASSFRTNLFKRQATSIPARVTSVKLQATSSKLPDPMTMEHGYWRSFLVQRTEGLCKDKSVGWMFHVERNLVG